MRTFFLGLFVLLGFSLLARADIDVHCEFPQVVGKWTLYLGKNGQNATVSNQCTYKSPNPAVVSTLNIELGHPNTVTDDKGNKGTWTMVVDAGFDIKLNGNRYFAFFMFKTHLFKTVSYCNMTFTGTYHEDAVNPSNWGCFYASKSSSSKSDITIADRVQVPASYLNKKFTNDKTKIDRINNAKLGWTAKAYPQFEGLTYAQMIRKAGGLNNLVTPLKRQARISQKKRMTVYQKQYRLGDYPDNFDWRKVNGSNYVSNVRDQGQCGSCYAFATTEMLSDRIRVLTQLKSKPLLSPQRILDCSTYDQGCDGGEEFLVSKFGSDFGMVADDCEPYHEVDGKCSTAACTSTKTWVKNDFGYIGGYYGACSEAGMIDALVNRGPFTVGFEVYDDFFNYQSGIYRCSGKSNNATDPDPHFEAVNHAVEIVGYGVAGSDSQICSWIVKNSWSDSWGQSGYFQIQRGIDTCGIESECLEANPMV